MKNGKEILSSLLKTTQMGQLGIRSCLNSSMRPGLRKALEAQLREYDAIESEAHDIASQRGWEVEELDPALPSPEPLPEEALLRKERQAELTAALNRLSRTERLLFYRKYYYRQSTAQIASELGMSARAVEGRLYRVKTRLRAMLGGKNDV